MRFRDFMYLHGYVLGKKAYMVIDRVLFLLQNCNLCDCLALKFVSIM